MKLEPNKATCTKGKEAWWYDEKGGGISVYISGMGTILSCKIRRSALEAYFKRLKRQSAAPEK